jgi:hypothetical protein
MLLDMIGEDRVEDPNRPPTVSVSTVISGSCMRCHLLERYTDYAAPLGSLYARWRGTAVHAALERNPRPGDLLEVSALVPIEDNWHLSLRCDTLNLTPDMESISDWKVVKALPLGDPYSSHVQQLQLYRWAFNQDSAKLNLDDEKVAMFLDSWPDDEAVEAVRQRIKATLFKHLTVTYLELGSPGMYDEVKAKTLEVRTGVQVATKPGAKNATKNVKVPDIWADATVEAYLMPRFLKAKQAIERFKEDGTLPPPEQEDIMPLNYWPHQYSATAHECCRRWYREGK